MKEEVMEHAYRRTQRVSHRCGVLLAALAEFEESARRAGDRLTVAVDADVRSLRRTLERSRDAAVASFN